MAGADVLIATVRGELEKAADLIMTKAAIALGSLADSRSGLPGGLDAAEQALVEIIEACSFQDLAGQRLSQLVQAAPGLAIRQASDPLLAGPAKPGQGLGQDEIDRLLGGDAGR